MQTIKIVDLEMYAHHGVYESEKINGQVFLVCAELGLSGQWPVAGGQFSEDEKFQITNRNPQKANPESRIQNPDSLDFTVDYAQVCRDIADFMTQNTFHLIETAADGLALMLLGKYALVKAARIEVKKPDAPIGLPLAYVSAVCSRSRHTAFIGLGSNLGDREAHLRTALELIGGGISGEITQGGGELCVVPAAVKTSKITQSSPPPCVAPPCVATPSQPAAVNTVVAVSAFKNTAPYGKTDQPDFLNAVAKISTVLEPYELLAALQEIELKSGRVRSAITQGGGELCVLPTVVKTSKITQSSPLDWGKTPGRPPGQGEVVCGDGSALTENRSVSGDFMPVGRQKLAFCRPPELRPPDNFQYGKFFPSLPSPCVAGGKGDVGICGSPGTATPTGKNVTIPNPESRVPSPERWEPRTLDLDILFYDEAIISTPELTVPHYDLHNRAFVLEALCELQPNLIHPVFRRSVAALAEKR